MINRRTLLGAVAAAALLQGAPMAYAADPVQVEIVALTHWPVENALKPIIKMLEGFGDQIAITQFDADASDGKELLKSAGQKGHVPVVILIDGEYQFTREDGTDIEFLNFPAGEESPMGLNGSWNADDVKAVINAKISG